MTDLNTQISRSQKTGQAASTLLIKLENVAGKKSPG
jgi:hypothetical protein